MEETVYKALSAKERASLVSLYESETMKAVKKALEIFQTEKAHHVLTTSPDHENTILNRGQVIGARFVFDLAKLAAKKENKKRNNA